MDWKAGFALILVCWLPFVGGPALEAQVVEGRVLDSTTQEPVSTARVTLLTDGGDHVETVLTDGEGRFVLRARDPGLHLLETDRLGYGPQRTEPFQVASEGVTRQDVDLVPGALELEGIVVEGYPGQLLHSATLAGVYARRARSPSVGNNRVLVRGDPDLDSQFRVRDVLPALFPRPFCARTNERGEPIPFVYFDAWEAGRMGPHGTDWVLDLPIREVEAIEYYRDLAAAPMMVRPPPVGQRSENYIYRDMIRACGIVAVWSRGAPR